MNRTSDQVAGESRDSDRNAARLAQDTPADPTVVANQSLPGDVSNPSGQMSEPTQTAQYTEPTTNTLAQGDTSATPYPPTQTTQPSSTMTTTPAYTSSTDMSSSTTASTTPAPAPMTTSSTDTPSTTSNMTTTDQPLPPRSDRN